ncbi:DUF4355 domain-containing protein [Clostridium botulinum]|uniref:capsid assembly scaffolding protein Gp46 family protein n=1 Tax=unclassified Clostridium TaxID=2614128 RepID=UPI000506414E|nr:MULTISPECIES: DUF4355 domain-containing protein [unclassified Clostridium]KFX58432.1 hypothetical protein KU40_05215 [Clostridium botulinum]MBY6778523.1 DUF4355 domain-containing protein [Clostridium botulinum]MBY6851702.1 DUF4355 domain-containing protein [Clostridium botulinum]NFG31398.1 DUF4355 domain-containing protein [Clostridium botulinum]NFI02580.1 DUF4355 domain-containing protein [Clostridium botulinum]
MFKKDLLKLIENIEDEGSVDEVLSQSDFAKSLLSSGLTLDAFKEKENDTEFKSYLDSIKDTHFTKALETWKANNLNKMVEAELLKRNPSKTPEQLKLEEMEQRLNESEKQRKLSDQKSRIKSDESYKGIDSKIIDLLVNEDEEITKANLALYVEGNKPFIQSEIEKRLKDNQYTPPSNEADKAKQLEQDVYKAFGL